MTPFPPPIADSGPYVSLPPVCAIETIGPFSLDDISRHRGWRGLGLGFHLTNKKGSSSCHF